MNFKDWFDKKLIVAPFPTEKQMEEIYQDVDIIINMSDEFYFDYVMKIQKTKSYFWFPMNERRRDIGLNSIFGALNVIYDAELRNKKVLLHCHSGRNRSRMTMNAYYFIRTGEHLKDGDEKYLNRLHRASLRGYLPPMKELEKFLKACNGYFKTERAFNAESSGGDLDRCKMDSINNF